MDNEHEMGYSKFYPHWSRLGYYVYLSDTRIYTTLKNLSVDNKGKCQILSLIYPFSHNLPGISDCHSSPPGISKVTFALSFGNSNSRLSPSPGISSVCASNTAFPPGNSKVPNRALGVVQIKIGIAQ